MPAEKIDILLVEDDPQLRLLLSTILRQQGFEVRCASDGFAALAELRTKVPCLLLSDLYMAGMSGFELLSVVRHRFPLVYVIAMSSAFTGEKVPNGIAADAFYAKASKVVDLLKIVAELDNTDSVLSDRESAAVLPIWIDAPLGEAYINMVCMECLRVFPLGRGKGERLLHETSCVHCHSLIHYAIVESTTPLMPRLEARSRDGECQAT